MSRYPIDLVLFGTFLYQFSLFRDNLLIGKISLKDAIQHSNVPGLDLIGSNVNLSGLEVETANDANRAFLLKEILN